MNRVIGATAILSTLICGMTTTYANEYDDVATVISATPIYTQVSAPRRECWTEQVASYEERRVKRHQREDRGNDGPNVGGALLGAVIGGVIGHQFGDSTAGRDHATAAGAVLGGVIGANAERDRNYRHASVEVERIPVTRDVQRCNTVSEYRQEISGYDVRYRYHGREYSTRLPYDPGSTMQVNVEVRPSQRAVSVRDYGRDRREPVPSYSRTY